MPTFLPWLPTPQQARLEAIVEREISWPRQLRPARSGRNYGHLPWQIIVTGSIRSMNRTP
jgi:hypothetical protein